MRKHSAESHLFVGGSVESGAILSGRKGDHGTFIFFASARNHSFVGLSDYIDPFRHLWRGFCQAGMPVQEYGAEVCAPIPVAVGVGRSAPSQPSLGWRAEKGSGVFSH